MVDLESLVGLTNPLQDSKNLRYNYQKTRNSYKKIEQFIEYYDSLQVKYYINGAPLSKYESAANYPTLIKPHGFQIIEEIIFDDESEVQPDSVKTLINLLEESLKKSFETLNQKSYSDRHLLHSTRRQFIRIMTLGVTGFDTPGSGRGIEESYVSLAQSWRYFTSLKTKVEAKNKPFWRKIKFEFAAAISYLQECNDFDNFDHVSFYKNHIDPLYQIVFQTQALLDIPFIESLTSIPQSVNSYETDFYDANYLNAGYYARTFPRDISEERAKIGKKLFFDKSLSVNYNAACTSCHDPNLAFVDGKKVSASINQDKNLKRNSPTTINSVFAERWFWDLRSASLEKQIESVIIHQDEFKINFKQISERLAKDRSYVNSFDEAYPNIGINHWTIKNALVNYLIKQTSFNSPFDQFMRGEIAEIEAEVKDGYNLFMGKAACGTCHFPPTFAGLVPPLYIESESEVLGVTKTNDFTNPVLDEDIGRFENGLRKEKFPNFKNSFKTPSIRNAEHTAPYMHNGAYNTLEEVLTFYNNGGGAGMGLNLDHQTLPPDSLNLTENEQKAIIAFINSLTDLDVY